VKATPAKVTTALLTALLFSGCSSSNTAPLVWPDDSICPEAAWPKSVKKTLRIAKGVRAKSVFEISSKGNGAVILPGIGVRVYDSHDEGQVFRNWLLKCEWRDVDGDGFCDLVLSGIAVMTHEKTGEEIESRIVHGVFRYSPQRRRFYPAECSPEIYHWEVPDRAE
jgi:hypothetical protein